MSRMIPSIIAAGAISLVIGLQPVSAAAGIPVVPGAPVERVETTTAPFDPICPLCFVREFFESLS